MPAVTIPDGGVILGTAPNSVGQKNLNIHSQQAMRVTFADNSILEDVLKHGADLKISFGKSMRFVYGSQTMEIVSSVESSRHELYRASASSPEELAFAATFTHQLEARELEDEVKDESLLALQESYRRINQEKEASTTAVVDSTFSAKGGKLTAYPKKTSQVSRAKPQHSLANTPLSRGARSPENSAHINAKLEALRIPLIHLLAMGPDSEQNLASKTRVSNEICVRILQKVGNRVGKQWQLVDDIYKDLDLWDFPYPSPGDRDQAIANCREAFNRLRLSREATEWQMILAPEDRGKVDPNPPPPPPVKLPLKPVTATPSITITTESTESKPSSQATSKKVSGGESMARTASSTKAGKPAPKDAISRIIGKKGKKAATAKATPKPKGPIGRPPKSATAKTNKTSVAKEPVVKPKVKSAERVEDSDEDIEMEDVKQPPLKATEKKVTSPLPRQSSIAVARPPSIAGSGTPDHDVDNPRLKPKKASTPNIKSPIKKQRRDVSNSNGPSSTTVRRKNASVKVTSNVSKTPVSRDHVARRSSSNSPPKPSPLGSSPPINASDIDNTSAASSPFLASIAGTSTPGRSPLDSVTVPSKSNKSRYLPVASPSLKRKAAAPAERDDRAPPSRAGSGKPLTSSAVGISTYSSNKRRNTASPDDHIIKLARKFKEDHARYERLYKEVQLISDSLKKKEKLDMVLNMHRDLVTLKAQISGSTSVH